MNILNIQKMDIYKYPKYIIYKYIKVIFNFNLFVNYKKKILKKNSH